MRRHLVLFVRLPRLGAGKKRLARDIGPVAALRFQRLMLARLLRRLGPDRRWRLRLAITPDRPRPRGLKLAAGTIVTPQGHGDLGDRMRRALAQCPPGPAVLVGSDIPDLASHHIAEAFRLLGRHDLIFGPTGDGGFWLVGARNSRRLPPLFGANRVATVRWSTPHVLADTLADLPRRVSVGFAARLDDVDDGPAWQRLIPTSGV